MAHLVTPGDWLRWAEAEYVRADVALGQVAADAHDEALYLILHALGLPLDSEPAVLRKKLVAADRAKLAEIFRRRITDRVPAAYLTREAWLGEHRFYVDERVIIPRSYFLEIIPGELASLLPRGKKVRRAVDVCTGSGCLAILLAHQFPAAQVDACDLSADALAVAKINVCAHGFGMAEGPVGPALAAGPARNARYNRDGLPTSGSPTKDSPRARTDATPRVQLFQSDVFDAVPPARYDVILSNPPYEPSAHVDGQAPEFAAEPRMAHDGGRDGLVIIRKLLKQARDRLEPHGIVVIEVGGLRTAIDREFAALKPEWLSTADGSDCVVLFRAAELR